MSDTDDTDSLLSVAAPSGLTNFLGLTVEQMSSHINGLSNNQGSQPDNEEDEEIGAGVEISREGILGQLGEWSDSDNENQEDGLKECDSDSDDSDSDGSTASTNSITLMVPGGNNSGNTKEAEANDKSGANITIPDQVPLCVEESDEETVFPVNKTLEFRYDKYKSPNYGVRVYPAQGMTPMNQSAVSGWSCVPGSESHPQLSCRAPNFRTPGGYKPREKKTKPPKLTAAQIEEEVRLMYAFPDADEEGSHESGIKSIKEGTELGNPTLKGDGDSDKANGNSMENTVIRKIEADVIEKSDADSKNEQEVEGGNVQPPAVAEGKIVKRNLFSAGDNTGSVPDLGFGLRDFDKLEVRENPVVRSHAWQTQSGQSAPTTKKDRPNVSFAQFRDENNLEISPIQAAYLQKNSLNPDRSMLKYRPGSANVIPSPRQVNLLELDMLWRDIRSTKERMEEDIQKSSDRLKALCLETSNQERASNYGISPKPLKKHLRTQSQSAPQSSDLQLVARSSVGASTLVDPVSKAPKAFQQRKSPEASKATDVSFDFSTTSDDLPTMSCLDNSVLPTDLDTLDISSILSAAHLKTSEFEEILEKLEDVSEETFEEIKTADDEIDIILSKLQISDWSKSGLAELLQQYQEEKYKREHCEEEIAALQSLLLKMQEESVVRDKVVSKKDAVLIRLSKAWGEMTKQWKAHEVQTKEVLEKFQKSQKVMSETLRHSRSRIEEYEKELAGAVELAASFKSKLEALELAKCEEVEKLAVENDGLKEKFSSLENSLDSLKVEKDTAVRALSESQKQLDERLALHTQMQEKLSMLENEAEEGQKDLAKVTDEKKVLEDHLQTVTVQKDSLEGQVTELSEQLKTEVEEKERLKLNLQSEMERQLREESDRLHNYYNDKLQEALQLQTQKMIATETRIVEDHQRQLSDLEREMIRKIRDIKNRCLNETSKMKNRYEKELKALRKDVAQKQQFISTISHQLQSYVQTEGHRNRPLDTVRGHFVYEGSSISLAENVKNNSEIGISSSTESTVEETTTKMRVSHHSPAAEDENTSSAEDFLPSKLSRYNTSTPNSAIGTPSLKAIKGWRELPDIKHLLHPGDHKVQANLNSASEVSKLRTLFPTTATLLSNSCSEVHKKCNGETPGILEQSVQKYVQSLVTSYSGDRVGISSQQQDAGDDYVRSRLETKDSPMVSKKTLKDNANCMINSGRLAEICKLDGETSKNLSPADGEGLRPTKHLRRPPWK